MFVPEVNLHFRVNGALLDYMLVRLFDRKLRTLDKHIKMEK